MVRVTPLDEAGTAAMRRCGAWACWSGQCQVPDDFDQLAAAEIADLFEGAWEAAAMRTAARYPLAGVGDGIARAAARWPWRRCCRIPLNTPVFSVASLWELVIKQALGRPDFRVEPAVLRRALLDGGWQELSPLHRDPFDRLLLA